MNKEEKNNNAKCGITFIDILTLIFITLKLLGVINWSWFWVLSPILIPLILVLLLCFYFIFVDIYLHIKQLIIINKKK